MTDLFSVGYEGQDPETFVWLLGKFDVRQVLDVRNNAVSRNRHFNRPKLEAFLKAAHIDYLHLPELGAPADIRKQLKHDFDLAAYFESYRAHLRAHPEFVDRALELVRGRVCALMCLERDHLQCHRSVLAEELIARGGGTIAVKHI